MGPKGDEAISTVRCVGLKLLTGMIALSVYSEVSTVPLDEVDTKGPGSSEGLKVFESDS